MLILLDKPNVLILDEPDNDLDVDMLAVVEGLLDTWPGTLLLITHDRHLMERVTDDQFALVGGTIRHLPGGVDEYLRIVDDRGVAQANAKPEKPRAKDGAADRSRNGMGDERTPILSPTEERSLKKELASAERKLNTLGGKLDAVRLEMEAADPSDYVALGDVQSRLLGLQQEISDLEDEWVRLSERLA